MVQQAALDERRRHRRCGVDDVDAVAGVRGEQGVRVADGLGVVDVQFVTAQQPHQVVEGGVEGERVGVGGAQPPARRPLGLRDDGGALVVQERGQAAHPAEYALGASGRPGGVDHVREVPGVPAGGQFAVGQGGAGQPGGLVEEGGPGQPVDRAGGQDQRGARVVDQLAQPLGRVRGVQGQERGARVHDRQQGDDRVGGARQGERDHVIGADPAGPQRAGQPVHPVGEVRRGQPVVTADQGGTRGVGGDHRVEGGRHVQRGARQGGRAPVGGQPVRVAGQGGPSDRQAVGEPGQQGPEPGQQAVDPGLVVGAGVDLEAEQQPAVAGRQDAQAHVLRRSARHVAHHAAGPGEVDGQVERLEVDAASVQQRARPGHTEVPGQVLAPVALVLAHLAHGRGDAPAELAEPVGAAHGHPQRQHVDRHGGGAQFDGARPAHQGQREHHVGAAQHAVQEGGVPGDQHLAPGDALAVGEGAQPGRLLGGEDGAGGQGAAGRPGRGVRVAEVGQRGEALDPVRAVLGEPVAVPVGLVGGDEGGEAAERGPGRLGAPYQGGVAGAGAAREHRRGVAVEDQVVAELGVPDLPVGEPDDGARVERPVDHHPAPLGGPCPLGVDECLGGGHGVGRPPDVEHLGWFDRILADRLAWPLGGVVHPQPQRLGLLGGRPDRFHQRVDVDRLATGYLHHVADQVVRRVRLQTLCVPDSQLRAGQGEKTVRGHAGGAQLTLLEVWGRPSVCR